jgi:fumarylpyruvate hydrolase
MIPVFNPSEPRLIPIDGSDAGFPIRRIFCVGRNYSDHVKEMGGDPARTKPIFFMKPAEAYSPGGIDIAYPRATADLHHEVELVIAIGPGGEIFGSAVGVDLTRRDLQAIAKAASAPWESAKAFERSAPIGPITPGSVPAHGAICLSVNGALRQNADLNTMTRSIPELLQDLSELFELQAGDLIFTGTPAGVSALQPGDSVKAEIDGLKPLEFSIRPSQETHR